jgi:20S proteasome alpha/beta subunit
MRLLSKLLIVFTIFTLTVIFLFIRNKENKLEFVKTKKSYIGVKGSFMIAAIGKDGIIVATETRGNIFDLRDEKETPIGYYDGVQKEFIIGSTVLANTGKGAIGNVFFSAVINEFKAKLIVYPPVDAFFNVFKEFYNSCMPKKFQDQIESNLMLVAGFKEGKPMICYFQNSAVGCIESEGYVESDTTIFADKYTKNLSCDLLAELAKDAIKKYSERKENWKTIGGDVCIIKITKAEGPSWLKKIDFRKWVYTTDLIKDYNAGKVNINLIVPFKKEDLEKVFNDK